MQRRLFSFLTALLFLLAPGMARAELVADLYGAELAVADRGAGTLRAARRDGLTAVLVKVSGKEAVLASPEVESALGDAQRYLRSYSYFQDEEGGLHLRLAYDEQAVQELLRQAGLPLWTANRPPVLVWLVVSDGNQRSFVGADAWPEASASLGESFTRRGVPLQLPLLDLEDASALTPGEAWRQSSVALLQASGRYRGAEILAGRVARMSDGRWTGDWRMLYDGRWINRSSSAATLEAFTDAGAALVAETLAGRYAVNLQLAQDQRHRVTLRGIRSYRDYRTVQETLAGLEAVRRVVPERLLGDQVSLRIEADADVGQLARIIELDGRFVPAPGAATELGLYYEWIP